MFGSFKPDPLQDAALLQLQAWVRERFALAPDMAVLITELACELPGCPPLETVVAFWTPDPAAIALGQTRRHHYKFFKPAQQVSAEDLPPYWMKDALIVPPDWASTCC